MRQDLGACLYKCEPKAFLAQAAMSLRVGQLVQGFQGFPSFPAVGGPFLHTEGPRDFELSCTPSLSLVAGQVQLYGKDCAPIEGDSNPHVPDHRTSERALPEPRTHTFANEASNLMSI